jgi:hypothetical protein
MAFSLGFGSPDQLGSPVSDVFTSLFDRRPGIPRLRSVPSPRKTVRSQNPFDFFGTLFTTPATNELNPMALLNQTL